MWVRDARAEDVGALAEIFWRAVREGAAPCYSDAERAAWAPERPDAAAWARRLDGLQTVVAEEGCPRGFMSLRADDGYLDLAFVDPEWRGRGVADRLYAVLEGRARARRLPRLTTHASRMACGFFLRHGWLVMSAQTVQRGAVPLARFEMEKWLVPASDAFQGDAAGIG